MPRIARLVPPSSFPYTPHFVSLVHVFIPSCRHVGRTSSGARISHPPVESRGNHNIMYRYGCAIGDVLGCSQGIS